MVPWGLPFLTLKYALNLQCHLTMVLMHKYHLQD